MIKYQNILYLLVSVFTIYAQDPNKFEIGVMIGEPTGISTKYWLSRNDAVDAAAGWSFTEEVLDLAVDYQRHFFFFNVERGLLPVYLGLGAALQLGTRDDDDDDAFLGARIPVGIVYMFEKTPLSIFGEIAPIVELIPETKLRVSGGAGIRLRFGKVLTNTL